MNSKLTLGVKFIFIISLMHTLSDKVRFVQRKLKPEEAFMTKKWIFLAEHLLAQAHINICVCVCVCVYTSVPLTHVCACICVYMHVCMSLPLRLCVHVSVCAYVGTCMQTKCLWVYLDIWQCMKCVCVCIFVFKCLSSISFA